MRRSIFDKKLDAAILERAFEDLKYDFHTRIHQDAFQWFLSEDWEYVFSCSNICDRLNFSQSALKKQAIFIHERMLNGKRKGRIGKQPCGLDG